MNGPIVGVAGMTHLGQVTAQALILQGFETLRFDICTPPDVHEPGLTAPHFVTSNRTDLYHCDIVYLAQDVETDTDALDELYMAVTQGLNKEACLVVLSQVPPGYTRALEYPPAERRYYQADTLITGKALARARFPEQFIVGRAVVETSVHWAYLSILTSFQRPIHWMSYESAELAKIAINFMLASQIAAANVLLEATITNTPGAIWTDVERALRSDGRIGQAAYIRPGAIGGHLPRDVRRIGNMGDGIEFASPFVRGVEGYVERD